MQTYSFTINNNNLAVYLIVAVVFFFLGMFRSTIFSKRSSDNSSINEHASDKNDIKLLSLGRIIEGAISATVGTVLATIILNFIPLPDSTSIPTNMPSVTPVFTDWSTWSTNVVESSATREVERRQRRIVISYNMVHFGTQQDTEPYYRMFRDYSIQGNYQKYHARDTYGEKHYTKKVPAWKIDSATSYPADGSYIKLSYGGETYEGLQVGNSTAYNFGDDKYVWFIQSEEYDTVTEYRYRDRLNG